MASELRGETRPPPPPPQHERKPSIVTSGGDDMTKLSQVISFRSSSEEWCCSVTYVVDWRQGSTGEGREGDEVEEAETRWNGVE